MGDGNASSNQAIQTSRKPYIEDGYICLSDCIDLRFFNLPIIFAVITAIVTIEHTAADSIKKAAVRFPASAIGALLATAFYGLFGKGALTFALVAMATIAVCHKLKLDAGILVATITATAMIPDFQDHYFVSFFTRLGTTSIGIIVSTFVNFFCCRPIIPQ